MIFDLMAQQSDDMNIPLDKVEVLNVTCKNSISGQLNIILKEVLQLGNIPNKKMNSRIIYIKFLKSDWLLHTDD